MSTITVLSTQEDAARGDRKEPSSGDQQAGGQAETSASGSMLGSVPTGYGNTSDIRKMTKEVMYVHLILGGHPFIAFHLADDPQVKTSK